jgi:hypothetical protein
VHTFAQTPKSGAFDLRPVLVPIFRLAEEKFRMKTLRFLLATTLLSGLGAVANASAVGFQVIVIDPPPSNLIHPITSDSFTFTFATCVSPGQVPQGTSYVGCFTGENATGHTLSSLQMFIPVTGTIDCSKSTTGLDLFTAVSCTAAQGGYILNYTGGNIPTSNGNSPDNANFNRDSVFTIAESGVDPGSFPQVTANFNPVATPEPDSLLLLSTGLLSGGGLIFRDLRRRYLNKPSR